MLTTLIVLIGLVLIAMIASKFMANNDSPSNNQYRRKKVSSKQKREPSLSHSDYDDSDAVLGLKQNQPSATETSLHSKKIKKNTQPPRVIALHLVAPNDTPFGGYDLLQAVLAQGLRFGAMEIFHRHEERSGRGDVLFSMASMQEPGTFDLATMTDYYTKGLSFFLQYDRCTDPKKAMDMMIGAMSNLRDELGGDIYDQQKQMINKYSISDYYNEIDHFLEKQAVEESVS